MRYNEDKDKDGKDDEDSAKDGNDEDDKDTSKKTEVKDTPTAIQSLESIFKCDYAIYNDGRKLAAEAKALNYKIRSEIRPLYVTNLGPDPQHKMLN